MTLTTEILNAGLCDFCKLRTWELQHYELIGEDGQMVTSGHICASCAVYIPAANRKLAGEGEFRVYRLAS